MKKKEKKQWSFFGELLGVILSLSITIYLIPNFSFVTKEYAQWLPIAIMTTVISGIIDIINTYVPKHFYSGLKALSISIGIYSTIILAQIFPFDFTVFGSADLNRLIQLALYISVFGMVIAFLIHIVKFSLALINEESNKD